MSGRPLPPPLRARYERVFAASLGDVRLHDDASSGEAAERQGARAITVGSDIVWGRSAGALSSSAGEYTLAHELAHVLQQRRGGGSAGSAGAEHDADRAAVSAAVGAPTTVASGTAVGPARQPKAEPVVQVQMLREYTDVDGTTRRVTEQEYQQLQERARKRLELKLSLLIDSAQFGRKIQSDLREEFPIVSRISDWQAGVTAPELAMWDVPVMLAEQGKEALASGNLGEAARLLANGSASLQQAERRFARYREASISGAETTVTQLEVTRDVSFAIAISAAVVVAAPIAAGAAAGGTAALGITGTGATIATGVGTATLTGVAGGTFGFALGGSSEAVAQVVNTGKVDTNKVVASGVKWGKEGVVQGVTGGVAKWGTGALKIGKAGAPILKELAKRGAVEAGSNFVGQTTAGILEDNPNKTVGSVLGRGFTGAGTGLLAAPLGMAGDKIAAAKPLLGSKGLTQVAAKGVGVVGASGLGALGAWVSGGDRDQILSGAATAGVSALAMSTAKGPSWSEKLGKRLETKGQNYGRVVKAQSRLETAQQNLKDARSVGDAARAKLAEADQAIATGEALATDARMRADEAGKARDQARTAWDQAPKGQRQGPKNAFHAADREAKAAASAVAKADLQRSRAQKALPQVQKQVEKAQAREEGSAAKEARAQKVLQRAKDRAAAKPSAAQEAREEWESSGTREEQAQKLGTRKGEHLHHAIELNVLDEFPGAFTPDELNSLSNMRPIAAEVSPAEAALLDTARKTPPSAWPQAVKDAIELQNIRQPDGTDREIPFLKERPPKDRPVQLHNSKIREAWNDEYARIKAEVTERGLSPGSAEWKTYVRASLEATRAQIDYLYGSLFVSGRQEVGLR